MSIEKKANGNLVKEAQKSIGFEGGSVVEKANTEIVTVDHSKQAEYIKDLDESAFLDVEIVHKALNDLEAQKQENETEAREYIKELDKTLDKNAWEMINQYISSFEDGTFNGDFMGIPEEYREPLFKFKEIIDNTTFLDTKINTLKDRILNPESFKLKNRELELEPIPTDETEHEGIL